MSCQNPHLDSTEATEASVVRASRKFQLGDSWHLHSTAQLRGHESRHVRKLRCEGRSQDTDAHGSRCNLAHMSLHRRNPKSQRLAREGLEKSRGPPSPVFWNVFGNDLLNNYIVPGASMGILSLKPQIILSWSKKASSLSCVTELMFQPMFSDSKIHALLLAPAGNI